MLPKIMIRLNNLTIIFPHKNELNNRYIYIHSATLDHRLIETVSTFVVDIPAETFS